MFCLNWYDLKNLSFVDLYCLLQSWNFQCLWLLVEFSLDSLFNIHNQIWKKDQCHFYYYDKIKGYGVIVANLNRVQICIFLYSKFLFLSWFRKYKNIYFLNVFHLRRMGLSNFPQETKARKNNFDILYLDAGTIIFWVTEVLNTSLCVPKPAA